MVDSWRKQLKKLLKEKENANLKNNKKLVSTLCENIGRILFENGLFDESLEQFEEKARIHVEQNKNMELAKTYHLISDVYTESGELEQALKYAQKHHRISREEGCFIELQRSSTSLGRIYYLKAISTSDKSLKETLMNNSLEFYTSSQNVIDSLTGTIPSTEIAEMRACLYLNTAILYEEWERDDDAEKKYKACASLSQNCRSYDTELKALLGLAKLKYDHCDYETALSYVFECIRCCSKANDKNLHLETYLIFGKIKLNQADFEEAVKIFKYCYQNSDEPLEVSNDEFIFFARLSLQALHTSRHIKNAHSPKLKAMLFHKVGKILIKCNSLKNALKYFTEELDLISDKESDSTDILAPLKAIADVHFRQSSYNDAANYYGRCLSYSLDNSELGQCREFLSFSRDAVCESYYKALEYSEKANSVALKKSIMTKLNYIKNPKNPSIDCDEYAESIAMDSPCEDEEFSNLQDIDLAEEFEKIPDFVVNDIIKPPIKCKKLPIFDPNKKNDLGETLLHVACIKGQLHTVLELLDKGADVHIRDNCGWLPLHEASNHGHLSIVEALLNHNSFIDDRGGLKCDGITPIIDAAQNMHLGVVKLLLERGADPSIADNKGQTPLSILLSKSNEVELKDQPIFNEIVQLIKSKNLTTKYFAPPPKTKAPSLKRPNKLLAISEDRVPLVLAFDDNVKNSTHTRKKKRNYIQSFSPEPNMISLTPSCRKRISVISSDDESPLALFPPVEPVTLVKEPKIFDENTIVYQIAMKDTNKTLDYYPTSSTNSYLHIYEYLQKFSGVSETNLFSVCVFDKNGIVFPHYSLNTNSNDFLNLHCYVLSDLSPSNIYDKLFKVIDNNNTPNFSHCFTNAHTFKIPPRIEQFFESSMPLFFTLLAINLQILDLSFTTFSSHQLEFISKLLPFLNKLQSLSLRNMDLNPHKFETLITFNENETFLPNLLTLDISFNNFFGDSSEISSIFSKFIFRCPNLESLRMAYCNLPNIFDPSLPLASLLQNLSTLTSIDISGNEMNESHIKSFFNNALPWNDFKYFNISNISKSYDLCLSLAFFMKLSKISMSSLDLSYNFRCDGIASIIFSSSFQSNIVELNLSNTGLTHSFITLLKYEFPRFSKLKKLLLFDNPDLFLNYDELFIFIRSSLKCSCLESINLSNTINFYCETENNLTPNIFDSNLLEKLPESKFCLKEIILNNTRLDTSTLEIFLKKFHLQCFHPTVDRYLCSLTFKNS